MIVFNNWTLTVTGLIARQYDNLSRRIDIEGNLPEGYTWQLLVQSGGNADTILLEATETGAGALLTADNLSKSGEYYIQLRGVLEADGVTKRHTNVVSAYIPESLTGLGTWPEVPTEFYQVEARILDLYQHPPIPGSNGYWLVWDTDKDEYVESQLALPDVSVGPQGPKGDKGDKGDPGPQGPQGEAGPGVPTGGTAGQVLTKIGDSDYAAEWKDAPADGNVDLDTTLAVEGKAADAKAVGDALSALSEEIGDLSNLDTDDKTSLVAAINEAAKTGSGGSAELPENLAYLQDVTVDEASGDFIPMLSPNGTEYRLSIGDDGIPIIKNISGTTVWTGTSGGTGGDSGGGSGGDAGDGGGESGGDSGGGSDSGDNADWVSGAEIAYTVIEDEYPSKTDGSFISDPGGYDRTDYIYCYGAGYLHTQGPASAYNAFYDVNKQFISAFTLTSNKYIPIPENAVYFVCSAGTLDGFVCKLYKNVEPSWTDGQAYSLSFVADEYVDNTTGVFTAYSGWKRTDYLNCVGASKISRTDGGEKLNFCALYNAEKEYMSAFSIAGTADITIWKGACYAVFSGKNSVMDALELVPYA